MMGVLLAFAPASTIVVAHVTYVNGFARGGMDNHVVGTAHHHLGLAIHIPVAANHIPLLVGACHEVGTKVNPPQTGAIKLIALVEVEVGRI